MTFGSEYYDDKYFADPIGKRFRRPDGSFDHWGYRNPNGESEAFLPIIEALKTILQPRTLLDAGAGRGTLVAYARQIGIEADGFDYSEWAVNEGRYPRCKQEWLTRHDATKKWPYPDNSYDLITLLDLPEHIYLDDMPFFLSEIHRVSKKWIFLQIAVAGSGGLQGTNKEGYILKKGDPIPLELEQYAVAGHVTLVKEQKWEEWLDDDDWIIRRDLVNYFISIVDRSNISNWLQNHMLIYEKM